MFKCCFHPDVCVRTPSRLRTKEHQGIGKRILVLFEVTAQIRSTRNSFALSHSTSGGTAALVLPRAQYPRRGSPWCPRAPQIAPAPPRPPQGSWAFPWASQGMPRPAGLPAVRLVGSPNLTKFWNVKIRILRGPDFVRFPALYSNPLQKGGLRPVRIPPEAEF